MISVRGEKKKKEKRENKGERKRKKCCFFVGCIYVFFFLPLRTAIGGKITIRMVFAKLIQHHKII
eukprot:UN01362